MFDDPGTIAGNHVLIIEALETGDPEQARAAMDYHIGVARKAVVGHFRKLEAEGGA